MSQVDKLRKKIFDYYADSGRMPGEIKMSNRTLCRLMIELQGQAQYRFAGAGREPTFLGVPIKISEQTETTLNGIREQA